MVILGLNAIVAYATMVSAWRAPNVAAFAVFGRHLHGGVNTSRGYYHCPFGCRGTEAKWVVIRIRRGERMKIPRKYLAGY